MMVPNFKQRSASAHQFSMVPRADIPRSRFSMPHTLKTTFDAGYLIPIYCQEILPGDSMKVRMTAFCRLATPLFPVMDNLHLESFFFFVPCRLVWSNFQRFMGEQDSPTDSISFVVPTVTSAAGGFTVGSVYDYFGLPTVGQVGGGNTVTINALPIRAYALIWNQWFRDENLLPSMTVNMDDGPDGVGDVIRRRRGKRHDYFTSCLPWPQKGGTAVSLPLGTSAPVLSDTGIGGTGVPTFNFSAATTNRALIGVTGTNTVQTTGAATSGTALNMSWQAPSLYADLSTATAATINQLRTAFQIQKLLERDARGGTRYTEIVRSHFGVISPDARLQRPEYLGGGNTPVTINPIAQTAQTGLTGGTTPLGSLAAVGTALAHGHGFSQSFTEHGYVIGLINVRADLTYQQGMHKMWSRSTRYDFYFPAFATLGEQQVLNREIYADGSANDALTFGYQERWAEYRYMPSRITGLFRSTSAGTIDPWHLAQRFTGLPTLGATFIEETPPMDRILAVGSGANGQQFLMDAFFDVTAVRPMPMYSVPGLIDHF